MIVRCSSKILMRYDRVNNNIKHCFGFFKMCFTVISCVKK